MNNRNNYLEYINENAAPDRCTSFIAGCEQKYQEKLSAAAAQLDEAGGHEIILLAGPSSSGKTTTASLLTKRLNAYGRNVFTISLDDYYRNAEEAVRDADGNPDFESVEALDIPLLTDNLQEMIEKGRTEKPVFDFMVGKRKPERQLIEIGEGDVVVVEGLHALNPLITSNLPEKSLFKIYVNLNSRIYRQDGKIVLNKRNIRFVRRMVRDYQFRNSSVENTFQLWEKVLEGEEKYLFPYKDTADIKINSLYLYEPCVLKERAIALLRQVPNGTAWYGEACALIHALKQFTSIPERLVPPQSLLREFLGAE